MILLALLPTHEPVPEATSALDPGHLAERARADIVEVEGSHLIMISQPEVVTAHILKAVRAVS